MPRHLRVLILEDSKTDERLLLRELRASGYELEYASVQTAVDMELALDRQQWDIILSDYSMPAFDAPTALAIVRQTRKLSLPFIIVSGTVGEDLAVKAMKAGANDFFSKDKLSRLVPAIERELHEVEVQQRRLEAENRFSKIFHASPMGIVISRLSDGKVTDLNQHFVDAFGYKREELLAKSGIELELWAKPEQRDQILEILKAGGSIKDYEVNLRCASGQEAYALLSAEIIDLDNEASILTMLQDISLRKQAEDDLNRYANRLKFLHQIDMAILRAETPSAIAQVVLKQLGSIFEHHSASVTLFDLKQQEYTVLAISAPADQEPILPAGTVHPIDDMAVIKELQENRIYSLADLASLPSPSETDQLLIAAGVRSYLRIPLIASNALLGSINLRSQELAAFTSEAELEIALEVAAQLAIALENNRLLETERQQNVQLSALQQASLQLTSSLELETILDLILDYAILLVNAHDAHIFLYDGETLRFGAAYWDEKKQKAPLAQPRRDGLTYTVARSNQELVISDVNQDPLYQNWQWGGAIIALPLRAAGKVNGVMSIAFNHPHQFEKHEIRILQLFADQAASAIQNAQSYQAILDYTDKLEVRVAERTAELQQEKEQSDAILRSSRDAILLLEPDGRISELNPAFCEIFNCDIQEILGHSFSSYINKKQVEDFEQALAQAVNERSVQRLELSLQRRDGTPIEMDLLLSPIDSEGDSKREVVCSLRDISLRKQVEFELRQALEKEKELSELKSGFTSMISHEFRTPLAVIQSSTDLLLNYFDRQDEATRKNRLLKIQQQVKRLTQLMDDVLFVGQSEQAGLKFNPRPVNLVELCESVIEDVKASYARDAKILHFKSEGNCQHSYVDEDLFRHIFQNILSNAFKYSPTQSTVQVRLLCNAETSTLLIQDEGIGMPEDYQRNLFKTFHRAQNVGNVQGTGLGLAIVKRAVDQHGGTIHVKSAEGAGTLFIVKLPNKP